MTILDSLTKSIAEEEKAARAYDRRGRAAAAKGYRSAAKLYRHIRDEEYVHAREYRSMRERVREGGGK